MAEFSDFLNAGLFNYLEHNYSQALEMFKKADESAEINLYTGICQVKIGQYDKAIISLNKAENSGEKNFEVYYNRALAYFYNEENNYAKEDVVNATKIASDDQKRVVDKLSVRLS